MRLYPLTSLYKMRLKKFICFLTLTDFSFLTGNYDQKLTNDSSIFYVSVNTEELFLKIKKILVVMINYINDETLGIRPIEHEVKYSKTYCTLVKST